MNDFFQVLKDFFFLSSAAVFFYHIQRDFIFLSRFYFLSMQILFVHKRDFISLDERFFSGLEGFFLPPFCCSLLLSYPARFYFSQQILFSINADFIRSQERFYFTR